MNTMKDQIDRLEQEHSLSQEEFIALIEGRSPDVSAYLFARPRSVRRGVNRTAVQNGAAGIMATLYTYAA